MKLLFLDCDGVLNNVRTKQRMSVGYTGIDPKNMKLLRNVIKVTGAKIVLSSMWRLHDYSTEYLFEQMGKKLSKEVIGKTPDLAEKGKNRATEICEYIKEFLSNKDNKIEKFVVLDDLHSEGLREEFGDNFVRTDESMGLTGVLADRCIYLLT